MRKLACASVLAHQHAWGCSTAVKCHIGGNVADVPSHCDFLGVQFFISGVCAFASAGCITAVKQSMAATMSPFRTRGGTKWRSFQAADRDSRLISATSWARAHVLWFLMHSLTHMQQWNESVALWVCVRAPVCVCLGDDLNLFISDLSYATQVIQHVKPMGRHLPWGAFVRVWVTVCVNCVNIFSCCRFAPFLSELCVLFLINLFFLCFYLFPFPPVHRSESGKGVRGRWVMRLNLNLWYIHNRSARARGCRHTDWMM